MDLSTYNTELTFYESAITTNELNEDVHELQVQQITFGAVKQVNIQKANGVEYDLKTAEIRSHWFPSIEKAIAVQTNTWYGKVLYDVVLVQAPRNDGEVRILARERGTNYG